LENIQKLISNLYCNSNCDINFHFSTEIEESQIGSSMIFKRLSMLLILLVFTSALEVACNTQHSETSFTDMATMPSARDYAKKPIVEKAKVLQQIRTRNLIDKRYPGDPIPWGVPSERVAKVMIPGILDLEDGRRVRLDGIRCDERAIHYLSRLLQDPSVSVVVLPSTPNKISPIPADVWMVDDDLQLKGVTISPTYSNLIETAITSGWCDVQATATSKYNARYAALAKAFQDKSDR
jgi:hypothetical protein